MTRNDQTLRSVLMVPAIVPRFIERAPEAGADVVCLDLEDSVPRDKKAAAREAARAAIPDLMDKGVVVWVRVNAWSTGLHEEDVRAVAVEGLLGLMVAKAESAEMMVETARLLADGEAERDLATNSISLIPLIETAKGVLASSEIIGADPRISATAFGAEDYCTDLGVRRTVAGDEVRWPRAQLAVTCAAHDVDAIDTADVEFKDVEYLVREMEAVRGIGFGGKLCIHPTQVGIANRVFGVSEEEIAHARAVIEAFEAEGLAQSRAAIVLDGRMIDTPHYEAAKRLLARAERDKRA